MLHVSYSSEALRDLRIIGHVAADKVMAKVSAYAANPAAYANQIKRLKGSIYLRLRVGNYRVLFTEDGVIMQIIEIGHRREIYR